MTQKHEPPDFSEAERYRFWTCMVFVAILILFIILYLCGVKLPGDYDVDF